MQKGNIGVTTENIFPVIKKFLYSDHEIFLREIVSNAIDATQKLKTLYEKGEFKGELGTPRVTSYKVKMIDDKMIANVEVTTKAQLSVDEMNRLIRSYPDHLLSIERNDD